MKKIVFATNNKNKLKEVRQALPSYEIVSLSEIGCFDELPEEQNTLEGNALQKAKFVFDKYQVPCFADDTGLLVDSLNNEPGVFSARYAGPQCDAQDNMDLLLKKLADKTDRSAKFQTVICLIGAEGHQFFEGEVKGNILLKRTGEDGFGYDPIFQPLGYDISFAQMDMQVKNEISHRGLAVKKLIKHLLK